MNIEQIEGGFTPSHDGKATFAQNGMVATAMDHATTAGATILKAGGNAVDAAVCSALALCVCEPQASGLGGQTMMLIHTGKKVISIDGSSRAPSLVHVNSVYPSDRFRGYRATTVPSTPATLNYVLRNYGTMTWSRVLAPAIQLAEDGYKITHLQHELQKRELESFQKVESKSGSRFFLKNNRPYFPGELFQQPELARTLKETAEKGIEAFYSGNIAKRIDADMRENGGLLRYDDLALIPWPIVRPTLKRSFRNLIVHTMPPPGAGRTLLFTLLMLELLPPEVLKSNQNKKMHLLTEIFRKAFLERAGRPFDPNFYPQLGREVKKMLRADFARKSLRDILKRVDKGTISSIASEDEFSGETTHLSVMDKKGVAVSLTQSIERVYGSKAAADGLGFMYNNYLMDFEYKEPHHPFYLRPNAIPWATVAPTIVLDEKQQAWMALGSPGSERIFSTLTQFLLKIIDENQPMDKAMNAPRIHCSMGGRISLEAERFPPELIDFFEARGYRLDMREAYSFYMGCIQAVMKLRNNKGFHGIADVRRDGTARGF